MGNDIYIDVHILVAPFISVSEGHYIAQHVDRVLLSQFPAVKDVTVHVDPEDDELNCPSLDLPNRQILQEKLLLAWQKDYPTLQNWTLHYIDGEILIDLECSQDFNELQALSKRIHGDIQSYTTIKKVRLLNTTGVIYREKA